MCAFLMESIFNYLGMQKIPGWKEIEKKLSPEEKLKFIAAQFNMHITFSQGPFQVFREIFQFRNYISHAKVIEMSATNIPIEKFDKSGWPDIEKIPQLQTDFEKRCNIKTAEKWFESIIEMTREICKDIGCESPFIIVENYGPFVMPK
jgi:hypothetical protein